MCRNIKPLFNFEPPASKNEMHDAALQFVRKISGYNDAVADIERVVKRLLKELETDAPKRDREVLIARAREKAKLRYAPRVEA